MPPFSYEKIIFKNRIIILKLAIFVKLKKFYYYLIFYLNNILFKIKYYKYKNYILQYIFIIVLYKKVFYVYEK